MTETPPDALPPPAVYRRREPGATLVAVIENGAEPNPDGTGGAPPLAVRFRVPSAVDLALIEARSREAVMALIQGRGAEARYGLSVPDTADETVVAALAPFITAVESLAALILDWNLAYAAPDGTVDKVRPGVEAVAELFRGRPSARAGWMLQYETVTPIDRAEGNASAASPDTTSATAANTAGAATASQADAAAAASVEPVAPAPAP